MAATNTARKHDSGIVITQEGAMGSKDQKKGSKSGGNAPEIPDAPKIPQVAELINVTGLSDEALKKLAKAVNNERKARMAPQEGATVTINDKRSEHHGKQATVAIVDGSRVYVNVDGVARSVRFSAGKLKVVAQ